MNRLIKYIISLIALAAGSAWAFHTPLQAYGYSPGYNVYNDAFVADDSSHFPMPKANPDGSPPPSGGIYGKEPSNYSTSADYNPSDNSYDITTNVGGMRQSSKNMSFDEYLDYEKKQSMSDYWKSRNEATVRSSSGSLSDIIPALKLNTDAFDQLFGSDFISIKFQGSAELIFGFIHNYRDDPAMDMRSRKTFNFDFQSKIQMNVNAKIGDKFEFKINHNTEALFAFENMLKLQYEGKEDEIIKLLQLGNIDFPLNTTFIKGSQNLFGAKAKLQFGKTYVTGVFSEQRSETKNITVQGGAQKTEFDFKADQYESNKNFFIANYFRNSYNCAFASLPIISSNINIVKMEVWVTNIGAPVTNNRNVLALTDLGENTPSAANVIGSSNPYPSNNANNLMSLLDTGKIRNINTVGNYMITLGYSAGKEYEKVESARKLTPTEYSFNKRLGFISLNSALNADQVLAVAYQYQVIGDTTVYQVGELSDAGVADPQTLVVKLLKSTNLNTKGPLWPLMMKNVYALNAYQVSSDQFQFNILYAGDQQGVPTGYFQNGPQKGIPLIQVFGMDKLDAQQNRNADGMFDFLDNAATEGGIIQASTGRVYFPYVEPFGKDLAAIFGGDSVAAKPYMYKELYEYTKTEAQQYPEKNKYYFAGSYKATSGSEIALGAMNVAQGSVKITAGSIPLTEDVDYIVDYTMGRVRIINEGVLNSGVPLNISVESNAMYNIMTKRLMGIRAEHRFSKNFYVGGTVMNLHQSSITNKVNYGEEPISNTIWGLDFSYEDESRWLTKMVDKILPFQSSKTPSRISVYGEFAHYIPGHAKTIGKEGTTYIDDFEGSKSTFNLKDNYSWSLASIPQWQPDLFPESRPDFVDEEVLEIGFNRAKLSWYIIDPLFYGNGKPSNISKDDQSEMYARDVQMKEVFPNKELASSQLSSLTVFNLAYYPSERGPYNYDVKGAAGISSGVDAEGYLKNPETRWAGIMRKVDNTDFEANNVENIEFWMMDPFYNNDGANGNPLHSSGTLYFNLGDVSEDLLRDGRKSFEHGLPVDGDYSTIDTTPWGRVPKIQSVVRAFDNNTGTRYLQDVGLDGLGDGDERTFFGNYLNDIATAYSAASNAYTKAYLDPSSDNYHYFLGGDYDAQNLKIAERYKNYNNMEGNSVPADQSNESYSTQQTNYPNTEDINGDNTLNESENYFQYAIRLDPQQMVVGENYITDIQTSNVKLANGSTATVRWYQFKVPVRNPQKVIGSIENFQSIRFIRMFVKGFAEPTVLRFASLELVKSEWRKYTGDLLQNGAYIAGNSSDQTSFNVSVVNIEENGSRQPVNYVLPPGIERVVDVADINMRQMNEQSLSMRVLDLADGDARAIYKTADLDMRQFEKLKMSIHAEKAYDYEDLEKGDLTLFIRVGADFDENYYEYEIPLAFTPWGNNDPNSVWLADNDVEIDLEKLVSYKEQRNNAIRDKKSGVGYNIPYIVAEGKATVTVLGTPTISAVKTLMIGVRNPKKKQRNDNDNGKPLSAEVWVNELRLTDFSTKSGFAATTRAKASLGDVGNVDISGSYVSANFGALEDKITELTKANTKVLELSTNLELGKFLPEKAGIRLPVHYDISNSIANPEYSPLDPDVKTKHVLNNMSGAEKDDFNEQVQDYTLRQNINFMNVRKDRTDREAKQHIYDIENFNFSYSYSVIKHRDPDIEYANEFNHRGGFGYNYNLNPKSVEPFAKAKFAQNKNLRIIKDINFYYLPKSFSFNTELNRRYAENKFRNKISWADIIIYPTYYKTFDWLRNYALKFDLTKALQMDYTANSDAYVDEPYGKIDTREKKDSVWKSIMKLGSLHSFNQRLNVTWNVPVDKLPGLDWVTGSLGYTADYAWAGAVPSLDSLGNTVSNANTQSARASVDFVRLYNKSPFLRRINQASRTSSQPARQRSAPVANTETAGEKLFRQTYTVFFRILMGFRNASVTYSITEATIAPGFMNTPTIFGNDAAVNSPGWGFVFGAQDDLRQSSKNSTNDWFSKHEAQNNPYTNNWSQNFSARTLFEPIPDLKAEISVFKTQAKNHSEYYKWDQAKGDYASFSPISGGNYSISIMTIKTAFQKENSKYQNGVYNQFLENRIIIANRQAAGNPNANGMMVDSATGLLFPKGYGPASQEVLIPAFISAYTGKSASSISLTPFPATPLPNWSITYNGLSKIKWIKTYFNRVTLRNAYRSSYNVGAYATNILINPNDYDKPLSLLDANGNFQSIKQIDGVIINEQFAPFIKIELELKNSLQANFEYKKSRMLALSFTNNQLTEQNSYEYVFGTGYRFKDVGFNVRSGNNRRAIKSDVNVRADVSIRSNKTVLHRLDQNVSTPSAGVNVISINLQADYQLMKNLIVKLYFDRIVNSPYVTTSYYTATTSGGISLKLTFNQ